MAISASALWIAATAAPSELPGRRLKERVIAGNWPWCMMARGAVPVVRVLKALSEKP